MNERSILEDNVPAPGVESPPAGYAGRPRDAQLEYKAILANASIGIAFTRDRKFTLCNPKFAEMLGWQAGELIGQSGEAVYPSRESYEAMAAIAVPVLAAGRQLDVEWEMRRRDGSIFLARMIAKAVSATDAQKGTVWIVEDITVRKRHADEVARLLREQEAILDTASIGICFVRDRRIVRCNRRMEEMYGAGPGELNGKPTSAIYAGESEDALADQGYAEMARGQTYSHVMQAKRRDGTVFWERATGRAVDPADPARGSVWLLEDITEHKRAEEELQRLLSEQQAITNNVMVGIAFLRNRKIVRCNRRFEELFGYAAGEALDISSRQYYFTDEEFEASGRFIAGLGMGDVPAFEQWLRRKDGSGFWCRRSGRALEPGNISKGYVWLYEDITERKRADGEIQRMVREQDLILGNATVGIAFVRSRTIQRCNRFLEEMVGAAPGGLIGQPSSVLFATEAEWNEAARLAYSMTEPGETYDTECRFKRSDGSTFLCRTRGRRIDSGGSDQEWIWSFDDVTAEREAESTAQRSLVASRDALERAVAERTLELQVTNERLQAEIADRRQAETRAQHLADHDALTGLPNRRLLEDRLTQALAASQRNRKQTAVVFVDLDRFKNINDTLGHAVGDLVLKEVSERLMKQLRVVDTVCRMGGDEFVVILPEIKRASDAANVAAKVLETMAQPFLVEERELHITTSIGISVFPDDGRDAESLIRNADAAMYHAKGTGRANYQFFTEQMNHAASRRLVIESDLRRAVENGEMRVYYQPVVDAVSGRAASHEALLRWQHPARGVIGPDEFLQVAEDTGLILSLGEWTLGEACRWAGAPGADGTARTLPVSVNLSARQFNDPKLIELVARVLKSTGLAPQQLELEIAETVAMQQPDIVLAALKKLKGLGVQLALDDFGIGLSGVAYLSRVPVDVIKIARSLVAMASRENERHPVVPAIVGLGHALGLKVVAKGVETEAQKAMLLACGCDYLQGFLTGKPVDAETASKDYV
jgi:diguanylate cyclase (GGDEF)-like protein/PAS domain S-box-containing protein